MSLLALAALTLLAQAEPAAEPPAPGPAAPAVVPSAPTATPADPATLPAAPRVRAPSAEELQRQLERIRRLPPSEAGEAMQDVIRRLPQPTDPKAAPEPHSGHGESPDLTALKIGALSEADQVKYAARMTFNNIIAGDARALVLQAAYPFQLEDRRLEMPDELHKEWLKNLRAKRTDLLTLYDIEVLTPTEMERKYGRPPARLASLPWKAPHTLIAVGNLSGRAAVAVFRSQLNGRWQLVGYHD